MGYLAEIILIVFLMVSFSMLSEQIDGTALKETILKFLWLFFVLVLIGYFIKSSELTVIASLVISFGVASYDFVKYFVKRSKKSEK